MLDLIGTCPFVNYENIEQTDLVKPGMCIINSKKCKYSQIEVNKKTYTSCVTYKSNSKILEGDE